MQSTWRNPLVWQTLGGTGAAVVLTVFVFYQPWVPVEITSADTGVLVALTRGSESVPKTPEHTEPITVPTAAKPEQQPAAEPEKTVEVELASSPTVRPPSPKTDTRKEIEAEQSVRSFQDDANRWRLGKPTVSYQLPEPLLVPASETSLRWSFVIPTGIKRDLFLTGVELRPGSGSLVKRMTLSFDPTGDAKKRDQDSPQIGFRLGAGEIVPSQQILGVWSPARNPAKLPSGTAYRIPAGADFVLTVEYEATNIAVPDPWSIGLHISTKAPKWELGNLEILLPAWFPSKPKVRTAAYTLPTDVTLFSMLNQLGAVAGGIRVFAKTPTRQIVPILQFAKSESARDSLHVLSEPITLAKGTMIVVETDDALAELCTFQVATKDPAHLQPLLRHNRQANAQR